MNGLAKLLKALYPNLNWATPEATVRSILPASVDLDQLINFVNSVPKLVAALAAKQAEIDASLRRIESLLAERQQQQSEDKDHGGELATVEDHRSGVIIDHGKRTNPNGGSGRKQLAATTSHR